MFGSHGESETTHGDGLSRFLEQRLAEPMPTPSVGVSPVPPQSALRLPATRPLFPAREPPTGPAVPPVRRSLPLGAGLLFLFFILLWLGAVWFQPGRRRAAVDWHSVHVAIRGTIGSAPESDVKLFFHFPEIPLDVDRAGAEVFRGEGGAFEADLSFSSRVAPHWFALTVRRPGFRPATIRRAALDGDPLECALPPMELQPLP